jgi:anti-sigma B factor antagonist
VVSLLLQARLDGSTAVLAVDGEVDMASAPELRAALIDLLDKGATSLVLDLAGVSFMDSSGLGTLVGVLKRVRERDGSMRLASPTRAVLRVLELASLDRILPVTSSVEEALEDS